jgi:hypothetical protein
MISPDSGQSQLQIAKLRRMQFGRSSERISLNPAVS